MDPVAVKTMMEAGEATPPDIADHFGVTLKEVDQFLAEHGIEVPRVPRAHKYLLAERMDVPEWESFMYEDDARTVINGINVVGWDGRVSGTQVLTWYHGDDLRCLFSGEPTTAVMPWDGNVQNVLITNLVPITQEAAQKRFLGGPTFVTSKTYDAWGSKVVVHLRARYDKLYGASHKDQYVDEIVDHAVTRYGRFFKEIAPSAELLSLWAWRQLSRALLKGLCRIDITYHGVTSILAADQYNAIVKELLQKHMEEQQIRTPIIVPPQGHPFRATGNNRIVAPNQGRR